MKNRRSFLLMLSTAFVAFGLIVGPALADELLGVMTKVDPENKQITVIQNDTDKEIVVTINDQTEYVSKKGTSKVDFEKLSKNLKKATDNGAKGYAVKVEHEKGVASKISGVPKKKATN